MKSPFLIHSWLHGFVRVLKRHRFADGVTRYLVQLPNGRAWVGRSKI